MFKLKKIIELIPLFMTLFGVTAMVSLGVWQLFRLDAKNELITKINLSLNTPDPVLVENLDLDQIYSKIALEGRFLPNNTYLYRKSAAVPGKDGYYLLSPFETLKGQILLVARGWFLSSNKSDVENATLAQQETISGIILPSEHSSLFVPSNDIKHNIWFTLNLSQIAKSLDLDLANVYMLQDNPEMLPDFIKPVSMRNITHIKNDHLEYALTWFTLSIALIVIFILYHKKIID